MEENDISPENQQPTRSKKPIHIWVLIGILGFTAITVIPYNIFSYMDYKKKEEAEKALIEKNKKAAEEKRIVDEKKKKENIAKAAELKKKKAEEAKRLAEEKKKKAEEAKRLAEEKKKKAEEAKKAEEEARKKAEAEKKQAELREELAYEKLRDTLKEEIKAAKEFIVKSTMTIETADGKIYKDAKVTNISPKGIDIAWTGGAKFLRYRDLAGSVKRKIGHTAMVKLAELEKAEAKRKEEKKKAEEEIKKKEAAEKAKKAAEAKKKAEEAKKKAEEAKKADAAKTPAPAPATAPATAPAPAAPAAK